MYALGALDGVTLAGAEVGTARGVAVRCVSLDGAALGLGGMFVLVIFDG